jgi:hypothetical protein
MPDFADIHTKAVGPLEITDEDKGEVTAIVGTVGQVDRDGDVFLPGAVPVGTTVKLSGYGHDAVLSSSAPVGTGQITEENGKLVLRGRFFMSTQRGKEAFYTVKELGEAGEWSVGFSEKTVKARRPDKSWIAKGARRLIELAKIIEASPVFQGAQMGTGTLAVKEAVKEGVKEAVQETQGEIVTPPPTADPAEAETIAVTPPQPTAESGPAEPVQDPEPVEDKPAEPTPEEIETKRLEDELKAKQEQEQLKLKAMTEEAQAEYERVQKALKRMGAIS